MASDINMIVHVTFIVSTNTVNFGFINNTGEI